jgi:hypothetical protein
MACPRCFFTSAAIPPDVCQSAAITQWTICQYSLMKFVLLF